jgi:hypothetical protein
VILEIWNYYWGLILGDKLEFFGGGGAGVLGGGFSLLELLHRDFLSVLVLSFFLLLWDSGFCRNLIFYFCGFVMFCVGRVAAWLEHGHLFVVIFLKKSYGISFRSNGGGRGPSSHLDNNFLFSYLISVF